MNWIWHFVVTKYYYSLDEDTEYCKCRYNLCCEHNVHIILWIDFNKTTEIGEDDSPQLGRPYLYRIWICRTLCAGRCARHHSSTVSLLLTKNYLALYKHCRSAHQFVIPRFERNAWRTVKHIMLFFLNFVEALLTRCKCQRRKNSILLPHCRQKKITYVLNVLIKWRFQFILPTTWLLALQTIFRLARLFCLLLRFKVDVCMVRS